MVQRYDCYDERAMHKGKYGKYILCSDMIESLKISYNFRLHTEGFNERDLRSYEQAIKSIEE